MANHAGLKRVVKTVRTKKGTKRQTFWVRSVAESKKAIKANKPPSKAGRIGLHVGAAALAAYGGYKLLKHFKGRTAGAPGSSSAKRSAHDEFMAQPGVHRVGATSHDDFMRQAGVTHVGR